jgi:hypothetical protein
MVVPAGGDDQRTHRRSAVAERVPRLRRQRGTAAAEPTAAVDAQRAQIAELAQAVGIASNMAPKQRFTICRRSLDFCLRYRALSSARYVFWISVR